MYYQVGGSLASNAPCYIPRSSDMELYQALRRGDFCYVLNSRQMGKSSLMVRTRARLQQEGDRCTIVDMSNVGSENITSLQWYKGVIKDIFRGFKLRRRVDFNAWWDKKTELSLPQRFSQFIQDILLPQFPEDNLVIFLDEIDSILSLPFAVDDFFAVIRYCYNQRAINPAYHRIQFAIVGVATPADLIRDRQRTPFNIGTPIPLEGFTLDQCNPLIDGLTIPHCNISNILQEILNWTNGQPFLTQKLCQLVLSASQDTVADNLIIPPGQEAHWVKNIVKEKLMADWEYQDEPEHLRTIRNRLLNRPDRAGRLLGIYQQILTVTSPASPLPCSSTSLLPGSPVRADNSPEQTELLLSGLVIKQNGILKVKNRLYALVFDAAWVEEQLNNLRPYSHVLSAWVESGQTDESRLLRGNALKDAQQWAQGKQLSDLDHQFLAASMESDRRQEQQALEAARVEALEAQLMQEQKTAQIQRRSLKMVSGALCLVLGLGLVTFWQYRMARTSELNARLSAIRALASSAEGNFDSHRHLDALLQVIQAKERLELLRQESPDLADTELPKHVESVLRRVVYGAEEGNRITTETGIRAVAIAPNNRFIAAAGADGTIYRWSINGQPQPSIPDAHITEINTIAISPDSKWIASGSADKTVKLWHQDNRLYKQLGTHPEGIRRVLFTGDGRLVSVGGGLIRLWTFDGEMINEWHGPEAIAINTQNQTLAVFIPGDRRGSRVRNRPDNRQGNTSNSRPDTGPDNNPEDVQHRLITYSLDNLEHSPLSEVTIESPPARMAFSPDGKHLVFTDQNHQLNIMSVNSDGQLRLGPTAAAHTVLIRNIDISADSQFITTASADNTLKLWDMNGTLLRIFEGHQAVVWHSVFFPKNDADSAEADQRILSAADDGTLRIWQWQVPWLTRLSTESRRIRRVAFSPDGQHIAAASQELALLHGLTNSGALNSIPTKDALFSLAFSPDGQEIATGARNGTMSIWPIASEAEDFDKQSLEEFHGPGTVWGVAFSADGRWIASASEDTTIKLWSRDGTLVQTLSGHREAMRDVVFSPDSRFLASSSTDGTINLWPISSSTPNRNQGQQPSRLAQSSPIATKVKTFTNQQGSIRGLTFSPNGRFLAAGTVNNSINIWNIDDPREPTYIIPRFWRNGDRGDGHRGAIWDVAFSSDGQLLASASLDGTVKIWAMPEAIAQSSTPASPSTSHPDTPHLVRTLTGHDGPVRGVAFSPDGQTLASASDDRNLILWQLDTILGEDELNYACRWIDDYWHYQLQPQALADTSLSPPEICGYFD
ncbi:MAG: AAA-like domain-containing protein [Cyanobacteria bacterium P01_F01_bin.150]